MKACVPTIADWRSSSPPIGEAVLEDTEEVRGSALRLLMGELDPVSNVFSQPYVIINPKKEDLQNLALSSLFSYWKSSIRDSDIPDSSAIDPVALRTALGNLMIVEPISDSNDFLYRLYGSSIAEASGRDWTGWTVGQMCLRTGSCYGRFYRAIYLAAILSRQPIYTEHYSPDSLMIIAWRRLIMPFRNSDGKVVRLLVGNIPTRPRELRAAQLERHKPVLK